MAEFSEGQRKKLDKQNKAMTGGRFPIRNREDLSNAIRAVGRAKPNTEDERKKVRRHIMRRARAIGATNLIPSNWASDGSLKGDSK